MLSTSLLGSVTDIGPEHAGHAVLVGSHGGRATGQYALLYRVGGLICHDAGIGLGHAGVEALDILSEAKIPAASVDFRSARIGDAEDMLVRGCISRVNDIALTAGVVVGDRVEDALAILHRGREKVSPRTKGTAREIFARLNLATGSGRPLIVVDSASSLVPSDDGAFVITGSHGGLPGRSDIRAIKARPHIAIFNDAGIGIDKAGIARLPVLDRQNIAAACIDANSARIGDGRSTYETGVISSVNEAARALGVHLGARVRDIVSQIVGGLTCESLPQSA